MAMEIMLKPKGRRKKTAGSDCLPKFKKNKKKKKGTAGILMVCLKRYDQCANLKNKVELLSL